MTPLPPLPVRVITWSGAGVLATVDGVRVQVRVPRRGRTTWHCRACGNRTRIGHCPHTQALADTPALPEKHQPDRGRH